MTVVRTTQNRQITAADKDASIVFTGSSGTFTLPAPIRDFRCDLLTFGTLMLQPGAGGAINNDTSYVLPIATGGRLASDGVDWFLFNGPYAPQTQSFMLTAAAPAANGLYPAPLPLLGFSNADGSALAASASSGKFGYAITLATSFALVGEAATGGTVTDDAIAEFVLPPWYVAGQVVTVTVNAALTGSGTAGTKTAQIKAYRTASDGTQGSDIGPGAAHAITAAGADITFAIAGATLNPGDRLVLELEAVVHETGGVSSLTAVINSVRVS